MIILIPCGISMHFWISAMLMMTDPPMSLGVFLRVHSFVRSIHKAEAGDAPLWTQLNSFNGRMVKIMPASPCHPLVLTFDELRLGSRLKTSEITHHLLFVKHCFLFAQGM